jgi:hypothetical protein
MAISVTAGPLGTDFVPWQHGYALPARWEVVVDNDELPFLVRITAATEDGRPLCKEVTLTARAGGLRARQVRSLPLMAYLGRATAAVAVPCEDEVGDIQRRDFQPSVGRPPLSDAFLRLVADIHRSTPGRPVLFRRAVARELGPVASGTLDRWVRTARRRGLL